MFHLTRLETFRQLQWRLFTGTCRMPLLLNCDLSLFFYSSRYILHISLIEYAQLTCNPGFGFHKWTILFVQSEWKLGGQSIF